MILILAYIFKTTIEAFTDVKTTDGYVLRIFSIAFTKNPRDSNRETSYAQHSKVINENFFKYTIIDRDDENNRRAV